MNRHLKGEAAKWADRNPVIEICLRKDRINSANQADVNRFKRLLIECFSSYDVTDAPDPRICLNNLHQLKDESLHAH